MARAYFYIFDQGQNWTVRYERRNYGMFGTEAAAYAQAMQWARDQGKDGHDAQVFTRRANGKYRASWSSACDAYPTGIPSIPARDGTAAAPASPHLLAALTLALVLAASAASADDAASGSLRICRQAGIVDVNAGKPIPIPSGATFVDNGVLKASQAGDAAPRLRVATTEASQIIATAKCTVAPGRVSRNSTATGMRVDDSKLLAATRGEGGEPAGWPGTLYLDAIFAADFRSEVP
jgi:hypothetical protein